MKIAHISDIHIDTELYPDSIREFERLVQRILQNGYDHLMITGDIVDVASLGDLRLVRDVLKRNGILHWERTTIIPGNHDIFGKYDVGGKQALDVITTAMQRMTSLRMMEKLHAFYEMFHDTVTDKPDEGDEHRFFPFVKVLDERIAIVGFNSVLEWSLRTNPTGARGYVHAAERRAVEQPEVLNVLKDKLVIAICHHAYKLYDAQSAVDKAFVWAMELLEKDAYLRTLKKIGATLSLHGHFHRAEEYVVEGVHFINSGAAKRGNSRINSITVLPDGSYFNEFVMLNSSLTPTVK